MTVTPARKKPRNRGAFTLVEMLTVIVIIGILAGLITGATIAVRTAVKRAIIVTEINQLEQALDKYKSEVGEYPPDFSFCYYSADPAVQTKARQDVLRHCRKRWPRATGIDWPAIEKACSGVVNPPPAQRPSPATALRFWLGGVWNGTQAIGFHEDPSDPFKAGKPRKDYYNFNDESNKTRLTADGFFPPELKQPFVYFSSRSINGQEEFGMIVDAASSPRFEPSRYPDVATGFAAVPYLEDAVNPSNSTQGIAWLLANVGDTALFSADATLVNREWRNEGKYQIIACGFDNEYSTIDTYNSAPVPPQPWRITPDLAQADNWNQSGIWVSQGDYDNITNFAAGELEDEK